MRAEIRGPRRVEDVVAHVVRVGPDPEVWVVVEVGSEGVSVAVVGAGRVTGLRDRDALVSRNGGSRELADQPAVGELVVEDDRIAVAVELAVAAEARPERGDVRRAVERRTALAEDLEPLVHHLDVLRRPDLAVGVRRRAVACDAWEADPVEVEGRRRHVRLRRLVLDDRVARVVVGRTRARVRARLTLASRTWTNRAQLPDHRRAVVLVRVLDDDALAGNRNRRAWHLQRRLDSEEANGAGAREDPARSYEHERREGAEDDRPPAPRHAKTSRSPSRFNKFLQGYPPDLRVTLPLRRTLAASLGAHKSQKVIRRRGRQGRRRCGRRGPSRSRGRPRPRPRATRSARSRGRRPDRGCGS